MKKNKGFSMIGISLILAISLLLPTAVVGASPGNSNRPDKERPVFAQDVHIVKKVTIKSGAPESLPGQDRLIKLGKNEGAATGILGAPVCGDRYAVVVGISDYPGLQYDLNYSDDDALDMENALTNVYGFTNVELLINGDATRSNILTAIENIPKDAGEVIFSFSGHGAYGMADDGDNEIVDEAIVAHDGTQLVNIWDGELRDAFSGLSTRIVFVFDSCMAGGMTDLEGSDRVVCMAASESELSYEYAILRNGLFTYYFVQRGILRGFADTYDHDGDNIVAKNWRPGEPDDVVIEEAFDYANEKCRRQNPVISDSFENDLLP